MLKVVICVSGGGTNLQAILDAKSEGRLPDVELAGVISNNRTAYALERAGAAGIPALCISPGDFGDREAFHRAFLEAMQRMEPDLIVLAGFLVSIPAAMVKAFRNRIINVHPSLIPSFCGVGYYGLRVHEKALERGVKITGATIHFVDEGMDTGTIIAQKAVEVLEQDTPKALQRRVMEEAEWILLPAVIRDIAEGKIKIGEETI
ncbi:MAG: phosphoribosylglycinamide formyltransferase [Lachnospiraceae bacterium]|nr:phosphoribosylglycinamide formyltransferase [Lachnospiraceae bacterium]